MGLRARPRRRSRCARSTAPRRSASPSPSPSSVRACATYVWSPAGPATPLAPRRRRRPSFVGAAGTTPCYYGECERDACRINSTGLSAKVDWVRSRHRNHGTGNRNNGTDDWNSGTGSRNNGTGNWNNGTVNRNSGTDNRRQSEQRVVVLPRSALDPSQQQANTKQQPSQAAHASVSLAAAAACLERLRRVGVSRMTLSV
jgi:hypothetical protein